MKLSEKVRKWKKYLDQFRRLPYVKRIGVQQPPQLQTLQKILILKIFFSANSYIFASKMFNKIYIFSHMNFKSIDDNLKKKNHNLIV